MIYLELILKFKCGFANCRVCISIQLEYCAYNDHEIIGRNKYYDSL
jgi:hypothetical protein